VVRQIKYWVLLLLLAPLWALAAGPDVVLKNLEGQARNVNEFIGKGKWVVVAIWHSDCPICKRDIHEMAFFHDAHKNKNAIVLGVSRSMAMPTRPRPSGSSTSTAWTSPISSPSLNRSRALAPESSSAPRPSISTRRRVNWRLNRWVRSPRKTSSGSSPNQTARPKRTADSCRYNAEPMCDNGVSGL